MVSFSLANQNFESRGSQTWDYHDKKAYKYVDAHDCYWKVSDLKVWFDVQQVETNEAVAYAKDHQFAKCTQASLSSWNESFSLVENEGGDDCWNY